MKKVRAVPAKDNRVVAQWVRNPLVEAFAVRLTDWRREKGLPMRVVAKALGVGISIISEWEHGNRFPSVDHLLAISKYTKIPASQWIAPLPGVRGNELRRTW